MSEKLKSRDRSKKPARVDATESRGSPKPIPDYGQAPDTVALDNEFASVVPEKTAQTAASHPSKESVMTDKIGRLKDSDDANNPHAFVVMPFGQKLAPDGRIIDFDAVYEQLIKPSLIEAGFNPFRADEETMSGDILTDMFQELLLADLVVADMSIDNANVFYELGVRHAFRKRGVVHIQSGRDYMPFDVFNVRTMPYHLNEQGVPDIAHMDRDRKNLIRITSETWASDADAVHSPIFGLLTGLVEPDRRTLRTPLATGFWREFNEWEERVAVARRQKRIGDILLLTEEIKNPLVKEDAVAQAGVALRELGRHDLALREYRKGLAVNSRNVEFRREEAVILNRMGRVDEAIIKLERLLDEVPSDTDATGCLGRIYTSIWKKCWIDAECLAARRQQAFDAYQWVIKSIDTYLKGFHFDLNTHEPGIKALNMSCLLLDLADEFDDPDNPDPDIERIRQLLPDLQSTLALTLKAHGRYGSPDYWTLASLAEWHITRGDSALMVRRAYRKSLSYARKNVFHLRSSLKQVMLFTDLGFHEESSRMAADILTHEIDRIESNDEVQDGHPYPLPQTEILAFLFSGHRLDGEDTISERFPADLELEVRRQIDLALDRGQADWNDHGFTAGAACGGEIVFIEACLDRGMRVHVHMPCTDADFINKNVSYAGDQWIKRFYAIRNNPKVNMYYQQERVGMPASDVDPFERNARWTLFASLVLGIDKLRHITLWDGKAETAEDEDGRLVSGMIKHTYQLGGIVEHLDITKLEYLFKMNSMTSEQASDATLQIDARVELLRSASLFASLHTVDLRQIGLVTEERTYADGETLALQGEPGTELFIIASGEVSVQVACEDGQSREIAVRKRGDCVGEMAILHDEIRMATLVASGEVLILVLSQFNFRKILRDRPETSIAVTRKLADRLIEATQQEPA